MLWEKFETTVILQASVYYKVGILMQNQQHSLPETNQKHKMHNIDHGLLDDEKLTLFLHID
jgi:hypothetical protein